MKELKILATDKDMTTHDLYQMGDFFESYISDMKRKMESDVLGSVVNISPATLIHNLVFELTLFFNYLIK